MSLINTTSEDINFYSEDEKTILHTIPKSNISILLQTPTSKIIKTINNTPFYNLYFTPILVFKKNGEEIDLHVNGETIYIVSLQIKQFVKGTKYDSVFAVVDCCDGIIKNNPGESIGIKRFLI